MASFNTIAHEKNNFTDEALELRFKKSEMKRSIELTFILSFILFAMWFVGWMDNIWLKSVFIIIALCFLINIAYSALLISQLVFKEPLYGNERQRELLNTEGKGLFKVSEPLPIIRKRSEPRNLQIALTLTPTLTPTSIKINHPKNTFLLPYPAMLYKEFENKINSPDLRKFLADYDRKQVPVPPHKFYCPTQSKIWQFFKAERLLKTSAYQTELLFNNNNDYYNFKWEIFGHLNAEQLAKYVLNLRHWISVTIFRPLTKEIDKINAVFRRLDLKEFRIGESGVDQLRGLLSQRKFVSKNFHCLPLLLDYLEICNNQVYLLQRLRCLSGGKWLNDYTVRMDPTAKFLSVPNDATIVFECICKYLDNQLERFTTGIQAQGGRPFYDKYVVLNTNGNYPSESMRNLIRNRSGCSILYTNSMPPKFNFMTTEKVYIGHYGYNHLFHVLLQLFIYLKDHKNGMLEEMSLGRNGLNILWTFEKSN